MMEYPLTVSPPGSRWRWCRSRDAWKWSRKLLRSSARPEYGTGLAMGLAITGGLEVEEVVVMVTEVAAVVVVMVVRARFR